MPDLNHKKLLLVLVLAGVCIGLAFFFFNERPVENPSLPEVPIVDNSNSPSNSEPENAIIGYSHEGRAIESISFGTGSDTIIFVGGIHGGYEWNSTLLAYSLIDHLKTNPETIPENIKVIIVPSANPDGLYAVIKKEGHFTLADVPKEKSSTGTGRFNAKGVDLNRNFDCKWQPESKWRGAVVSAGTSAFSEPEAQALRDLVLKTKPQAVILWHSQANAVYASECEKGILPDTLALMNNYSKASGYKAIDSFDAYPVTGDAEGWLASINIPAITVELKTHETVEWEQNLAGVESILVHYAK